MPKIRRKGVRQRGLNDAQEHLLIFGCVFGAHHQERFASEVDERAAWELHRERLMAQVKDPGRRPHAYYKFDLGVDPPWRWFDEIEILLDHNLIGEDEAIKIERNVEMLSGDQAEAYCASFDGEKTIAWMQLSPDSWCDFAEQFDVAAKWHQWRGREGLAERYRTRAELMRAYTKPA